MINNSIDAKSERSPMERFWGLIKSMRFAVWLLVILAGASIFNLFANEFIISVDGNTEEVRHAYLQEYGEPRASLLILMKMYAPYSSWWYTLLLTGLLVSLLACTIDRAPAVSRKVFRPRFLRNPASYEAAAIKTEFKTAKDLVDGITTTLSKFGYRVWKQDEGDAVHVSGKKHAIAEGGIWLVHVGFIFLIVGGAMIARGSYSARAGGLPGDFLAPDETWWGFNVRVDDFEIEYHAVDERQLVEVDGRIIGKVLDNHGNGTFDIDTFEPRQGILRAVDVDRISNRFDRQGSGGRLDKANIADYIATLTVFENGDSLFTRTVEVNHPLRYKGYRFYQSSYDDRHTDERGKWTTILQVRKDRGSFFVWLGLSAVSLGLVLGLYLVPRQVFARLQIDDGETRVLLAGRTARGEAQFREEFAKLTDVIGGKEKNK